MRETLHLPETFRQRIIDHCRAALPDEGCGLFAVDDGNVVEVYETSNSDSSPTGYTVPPEEHLAALEDAESRGWEIGGVFHSHPTGSARPSMIDVRSALERRWVYLVVGLRGRPEVRGWMIPGNGIREVDLV